MKPRHTSSGFDSSAGQELCGFVACIAILSALAAATPASGGSAPPYNNCSSALEVTVGETAFTNDSATLDGPGIGCSLNIGADVWFKFTPSFNGLVTISTCDDADFDTIIVVYSGCTCDSFATLGCNDENPSCPDHTSRLTVNVQAYQCYRIRVLGFGGDTGTGVLKITCTDPANAGCAGFKAEGAEAGDQFGTALSDGGRMNNDARADFVVGAPWNDYLGTNRGRAYALRGDALTTLYNFNGTGNGERMGNAVCSGCDLNADGRVDIVVAAPFNDLNGTDSGRVWAYSGIDRELLWSRKGVAAGDRFGHAVACAGDVDNDGFDDIIIGAPFFDLATKTDVGRAYVVKGNTGAIIWTITGQAAGENFGFAVAGAGDLNDDDKDDFVIGAPAAASNKGKISLFNGSDRAVLQRINGDTAGDRFGEAIAAGEFTLSTVTWTYMLVGAPHYTAGGANAGRVKIYTRNHTTPVCPTTVCLATSFNGENAGDQFGTSVALGQIFGGNQLEMLIGAPFNGLNGTAAGAAYLFDGGNLTLAQRFLGEANNDRFGSTVAIAGDIDGDTDTDLAVGAPMNDFSGNNAGRVYVFANSLVAAAASTFGGVPITPIDRRFADINRDGSIDSADVIMVITSFGPCSQLETDPCAGDVDHTGTVDMDDMLRVLNEIR